MGIPVPASRLFLELVARGGVAAKSVLRRKEGLDGNPEISQDLKRRDSVDGAPGRIADEPDAQTGEELESHPRAGRRAPGFTLGSGEESPKARMARTAFIRRASLHYFLLLARCGCDFKTLRFLPSSRSGLPPGRVGCRRVASGARGRPSALRPAGRRTTPSSLPIWITGEMVAAVPAPNASWSFPFACASWISSIEMRRSSTGIFISRRRVMALSLVTPRRIVPESGGRHRDSVDDEEDVHGAAFLGVAVVLPVEPEDVVVALVLGFLRGVVARGVVSRRLRFSGPAFAGAHVLARHPELHRLAVVRPHGTGEDDEPVGIRGPDSDVVVVREHERSEVERASLLFRDPCRRRCG